MNESFECLKKDKLFSTLPLKHYRHLKNGLEVVISPNDESEVLALQIWYRVGSANEEPTATGLAHFFEHMMFRGTKAHGLGEFDRQMEELGTPWGTNAFTWKDFTAYVVDIPFEGLETALMLEADRMVNLELSQSNIHEERGAVLDEKGRSLNDYSSQRFEALFEKVFEGDSAAWPVLGYEDHIRSYHPELLQAYYEKNYAPDNALIVLCGRVDTDEALDLVDKYFGTLPASGQKREELSRRFKPGILLMKQPISLTRLTLSFALDSFEEPPWIWDLLGLVLAGNEASLFEREFVIPAKVLNYSYWLCESTRSKESDNFFQIGFTLMEGVTAEEIIKALEKLFAQPELWLTEEMLKPALIAAQCDFYNALCKFDDRASALGETWIYDNRSLDALKDHEEFYKNVEVDILLPKVKSLLTRPRFTMETQPE
jgi:zinc protease